MNYLSNDDMNGHTELEVGADSALRATGDLSEKSEAELSPFPTPTSHTTPGDIPSDPHLKITAVEKRESHAQATVVHGKPPTLDPNVTLEADAVEITEDRCPFCDAERRPTDNFCSNCGNLLKVLAFDECRYCQTTLVPDARFCHHCGRRVEASPQLMLRIAESNTVYTLRGEQESYTIGRTVPEQNNFVDIDLGPLGQRKVSRRHARIFLHENQWYVEDLGSKGGTRVFNQLLQPRSPLLLQDSMVIYFADVKFKVELQN